MVRTLFLLMLLLTASMKPVTIAVKPEQSFAPASVILTVRITRSPENRSLSWACDSGEFYRSSTMTLDGENSPAQFVEDKALRSVPEGEYDCAVEVLHADGSKNRAVTHFRVMGAGQ